MTLKVVSRKILASAGAVTKTERLETWCHDRLAGELDLSPATLERKLG